MRAFKNKGRIIFDRLENVNSVTKAYTFVIAVEEDTDIEALF